MLKQVADNVNIHQALNNFILLANNLKKYIAIVTQALLTQNCTQILFYYIYKLFYLL